MFVPPGMLKTLLLPLNSKFMVTTIQRASFGQDKVPIEK